MCIVIEEITSSSLSFSNHSPFLKLFKVCPCCVGSASRHGQLFTVSLKSQPIYQSFQSLFFVVCMLLADMAYGSQCLSNNSPFSSFPKYVYVVWVVLADMANCSLSRSNHGPFSYFPKFSLVVYMLLADMASSS